jgi:4-amino-4-deoxy-L-arabinose transferase-like glycosyltransferase
MKVNNNKNRQTANFIIPVIKLGLILLLLVMIAVFIGFLFSYETTALIANRFAADGNLESFSPQLFHKIQIAVLVASGLIFLLCLSALLRFKQTISIILRWQKQIPILFLDFIKSWKGLFLSLKEYFNKNLVLNLVLITIFSFLIRIALLWQPMQHDESYSSVIFAFEPLYRGLADYHFPNNHVFHTFLVHISYLIFGPQEWAVRLPAFSAGILLAPLSFILAERWYGKKAAWLAGILVATMPELIRYSVNARGYSIMALLTLFIFILTYYVKRNKNYAAWFLIGIFGAIGFYTLPIMVYPLFILYSWLGISWMIADYGQDYDKTGFLLSSIFSGLLAVVLGLALYIPIFRNWGISGLFANPYVQAMPQDLYSQTVQSRLIDTRSMLNAGPVPYITIILLSGVLLSILFNRYPSKDKVPLQITSLITIILLVSIQRPNIFPRTWHFYLPLICIWASAGLVSIFKKFVIRLPVIGEKGLSSILILFWGLIFIINGVFYTVEKYPESVRGNGDVEQATIFLKGLINQNDIVVITAIDDAKMWFYFEKYGLGRDYFSRSRPFEKAYVVVTISDNQTVDSVIADRGPDRVFFDMETTKKINTINSLDIYLIQANQSALNKAYDKQ